LSPIRQIEGDGYMVVGICQPIALIDNVQNNYKPRMKLFPHSNYTPLFILYKNIRTCNSLRSKFCFLDSSIGNSNNSFTRNTKLKYSKCLEVVGISSPSSQIFVILLYWKSQFRNGSQPLDGTWPLRKDKWCKRPNSLPLVFLPNNSWPSGGSQNWENLPSCQYFGILSDQNWENFQPC
jgi:hypothetical protein